MNQIFIISGPPGVGKTRHAELYAQQHDMALVYYQCHAWTDADELYFGVNVQAAVAGEVGKVRQPGVLAIAAESSNCRPTCLILDELDKTSDKAEALLLDFLQSGRVPIAPGQHIVADIDSLVVFIITNGYRDFSDALLRRGRRIWMKPLPINQQTEIIAEKAKCPVGLARVAWKAARWVAMQEGNSSLSMQEGWNMIKELLSSPAPACKEAVEEALAGWAARTANGAEAVKNCPFVSALLAELKRIF
jgi:MoxR-like ATPase